MLPFYAKRCVRGGIIEGSVFTFHRQHWTQFQAKALAKQEQVQHESHWPTVGVRIQWKPVTFLRFNRRSLPHPHHFFSTLGSVGPRFVQSNLQPSKWFGRAGREIL
jgi:hypothetical protein